MLISVLVIILVIGAIIVVKLITTDSGNLCNYNDPNKSYINKGPNCVINFMCMKDRTAFRDECGCGCGLNP
jgi:hypothetical protein